MNNLTISVTEASADYELIDSGDGEKLERFGKIVLSRPDPQALWHKRLSAGEWKKAEGYFGKSTSSGKEKGERGDWSLKSGIQERWQIDFAGLKFWIKPTVFKHVGIFPEQQANWAWMREIIKKEKAKGEKEGKVAKDGEVDSGIEVLNLFGYTGGASLACAQAGAKVVHVDGSKTALAWARENAELSGLKDKPIRWILDDARDFVRREAKRGRKYQGIIMDPPAFGHGPNNELWKIEEHLLPLIEACMSIMADKPLFFIMNGYSAGYSAIAYENDLLPLKDKFGGDIEIGELALEESSEPQRLLPCGIFARWSAK
jgi:23S rRNA (cytosine1962-C5)-methyltransferase